MTRFSQARALALALPAALLAGAWGSQLIGGLFPCEMCLWQRWPHYAAVGLALAAFLLRGNRLGKILVAMAGFAILTSGIIGVVHAGVEYGWWPGFLPCSQAFSRVEDIMTEVMKAPLVSCNQPQWTFANISLAGFNAIISLGGGVLVLQRLLVKSA